MKLEVKAGWLSLERQRLASIGEGNLNLAKDLRPALLDEGVPLMFGNNLAGGHVWLDESPPLVVTDTPTLDGTTDEGAQQYPEGVTVL